MAYWNKMITSLNLGKSLSQDTKLKFIPPPTLGVCRLRLK